MKLSAWLKSLVFGPRDRKWKIVSDKQDTFLGETGKLWDTISFSINHKYRVGGQNNFQSMYESWG